MTGKEALEYIANLLFMFTSAGRKSGNDYVLKALCKIEDELDELDKYKRAFEILKEILSLNKDKSIDGKVDFYTLYFTGQFPYEIYKRLEKEEYELLEELMSDGKINYKSKRKSNSISM